MNFPTVWNAKTYATWCKEQREGVREMAADMGMENYDPASIVCDMVYEMFGRSKSDGTQPRGHVDPKITALGVFLRKRGVLDVLGRVMDDTVPSDYGYDDVPVDDLEDAM